MNNRVVGGLLLFLVACGGADEAPATTAVADSLTKADSGQNAPPKRVVIVDTGAVAAPDDLVRETYAYSFTRAGRDPFRGLTVVANDGPELPELRLISIIYNHTDPKMSLATFSDIGNKKQYNVRPGDRIGRLLVVSIELNEAVLRGNDFGTVRQQTYPLIRAEEGNP